MAQPRIDSLIWMGGVDRRTDKAASGLLWERLMSEIFYQHDGWLHITSKDLSVPERVLFFSTNPLLAVRRVNYRAAVPPPAELCATECQALNRLIELLNQHIERLQSRFESLRCLDGDDAISEGYAVSRTIRMAKDLLRGLQSRRDATEPREQ